MKTWRILGLAGLLGVGLCGCGSKAEKQVAADTGPKPVPVKLAPVEKRTVERSVEVVGTLRGWEQVTVGSKRTGRVLKVFHDMGDRVKPGELLVKLETIDADLSVLRAERTLQADLAKIGLTELPGKDFDPNKVPAVSQANSTLERARREHTRQKQLYARSAGAYQDLQNAETDERGAEAGLENAIVTARSTLAMAMADKAALDAAVQTQVDTEIHAPTLSEAPKGHEGPIEFAIAKRYASEGQMVKEGEAIVDLVMDDPLRLWTNVPEKYSSEVAIGQGVRVSVASYPGETFEGTVARINPTVDSASRTFQVETLLPNPKGRLHPGGFAKASILTRRDSDSIVVPLEAIVRFAGVTKVFVAKGDKAREVAVETGLEGRDWTEVVGSISPGEQVVVSGQVQLADGSTIVVLKPETTKPEEVKPSSPVEAKSSGE